MEPYESWLQRILPDDIVVARSAFEAANIRFTESEVHLVLLENKAGVLANVSDRLGEAGLLSAAAQRGVVAGGVSKLLG